MNVTARTIGATAALLAAVAGRIATRAVEQSQQARRTVSTAVGPADIPTLPIDGLPSPESPAPATPQALD